VASSTKHSTVVRLNKQRKAGKKRKRALAKQGTTKNALQMFGTALPG
jgi:hypothetical protein